MLYEHCRVCKKRRKCEYGNAVWYSCKYKNEVVSALLGNVWSASDEHVSSCVIMRCSKCLRVDVRGRFILGVAICYDCYPFQDSERRVFENGI